MRVCGVVGSLCEVIQSVLQNDRQQRCHLHSVLHNKLVLTLQRSDETQQERALLHKPVQLGQSTHARLVPTRDVIQADHDGVVV